MKSFSGYRYGVITACVSLMTSWCGCSSDKAPQTPFTDDDPDTLSIVEKNIRLYNHAAQQLKKASSAEDLDSICHLLLEHIIRINDRHREELDSALLNPDTRTLMNNTYNHFDSILAVKQDELVTDSSEVL